MFLKPVRFPQSLRAVPTKPVPANNGFTAIELLATIAILSLLVALAAPSFIPLIERWRIMQTTELLKSSLYYARSESIKRGGQVVVQKIANNTHGCTTAVTATDWDCGWFVCADSNGNGACDAGEPILQRYDTPPRVQVSRTGGSKSIKFNRWGLVDGVWLGFSLVPMDRSTVNSAARGVCMSSGGRIQVIPPEAIPCTG